MNATVSSAPAIGMVLAMPSIGVAHNVDERVALRPIARGGLARRRTATLGPGRLASRQVH
ncbi:hypothetical protein [Paraburkholderia sp. EG304]|uniref:hypothetical protein n=1 Tax=Paraburkholderia sp. EG304 TaxID=3237015 RepID=UPI00397C006C